MKQLNPNTPPLHVHVYVCVVLSLGVRRAATDARRGTHAPAPDGPTDRHGVDGSLPCWDGGPAAALALGLALAAVSTCLCAPIPLFSIYRCRFLSLSLSLSLSLCIRVCVWVSLALCVCVCVCVCLCVSVCAVAASSLFTRVSLRVTMIHRTCLIVKRLEWLGCAIRARNISIIHLDAPWIC
eukprot:COSAG05_NODE_1810_length_4040_cov_11.771885_4_plen_182_part_00